MGKQDEKVGKNDGKKYVLEKKWMKTFDTVWIGGWDLGSRQLLDVLHKESNLKSLEGKEFEMCLTCLQRQPSGS